MGPATLYRVENDGVAVLTLSNPPVNALHPNVLRSLFESLQTAHNDTSVTAIVVIGDGRTFSAGFDINQFQSSSGGGIGNNINDAICDLLESGPKPTVAAIAGVALGGGLEIAMGCNGRVCVPGAKLGLPELQLGILPGFGGTQRLPRLVGLQNALQAMLTSKPFSHKQAEEMGLVDAVVPAEQLLQKAKDLAKDIAAGRRPRAFSLLRTDKLEPFAEALAILEFAKAQTMKRAPNLTHPLLCIEAVQYGVENGGRAGLVKEGECFARAASLDTHRGLVHVFLSQRSTKKVKGVTDQGLRPRNIRAAAVLGGGLMGSGIATAFVLSGIRVVLKEVNQQFLEGGINRIRANLNSKVKKGSLTQKAADSAAALVQGTLDYSLFKDVDIVIEAVLEDVSLKQKIFSDLEASCNPDCVLATNTSTIDISLVGKHTKSQKRIVGAHFFSPAHIMPLLEIVRTEETDKQVVLDLLELSTRIKKTPVVVGNCTGFAVNRVFFPYTMAACMLVDIGLNPYTVDKAIGGVFGMPMGPFRLSDLVGADIGLHVGKNVTEAFPARVYPSMLIPLMTEAKRLGEKTGKGFYKYDDRRRASMDPDIAAVVAESREASVLRHHSRKPLKMSPQDIIDFIFFPVINEACRVIDEGIVDKPSDLDVASVMAMGFPPYRGGLVFWADLVGAARICDKLHQLCSTYGEVAGFFEPCRYLEQCARNGTKLGAGRVAAAKL